MDGGRREEESGGKREKMNRQEERERGGTGRGSTEKSRRREEESTECNFAMERELLEDGLGSWLVEGHGGVLQGEYASFSMQAGRYEI
jgi:hypothetical protein